MILDPDACIHDAGFFRMDQRTDEQADSRSWIDNLLDLAEVLDS